MFRKILILVTAFLTGGCTTFGQPKEPPRVSLADVGSLAIEGFEQRYRIKLRVQNPNREPLVVQGISFHLYLNDQKFADGVGPAKLTIDPFADAVMTVDVTSDLHLLFRQLQRLPPREGPAPPWPATGPGVHWRIDGQLALAGRRNRTPFQSEGRFEFGPPGAR